MIINKTLESGIRVSLEQIPYVKSVSTGIWVRAGSVDEEKKNAGISHYIEHMMFKGTEARDAKRIAEDVDRIGGQINAFTGREATCYYLKTMSSNFAEGFGILADMLLHSKFDREELEKERNVIFEEIKMIEDSPEDDIQDIAAEIVFRGTPLGRNVIGTPVSLNAISRAAVRKYVKDRYIIPNIVVSVAGSFDADLVCGLIEEYFSELPAPGRIRENARGDYTPRFRSKIKDIEQSHLCLATRSVSMDDDRYYSMSLLNSVIGGSMSSRLFQNIREQKGLAYSVYSMNSSFVDDGYFNIYAGVSHDKVKAALSAISDELRLLKNGDITAEELSMAKEQMKAGYIFGLENVNGRMFSNGRNMLLLNKIYTPEEILARIEEVSQDDMRETAKLISDISAYSAVSISRKRVDLKGRLSA
ncbi:MAG: insulinase family protein [Clostridiales Family XIII bacterium]|nr:insulinase family protein [Clostridiales Family XIII bacterium]